MCDTLKCISVISLYNLPTNAFLFSLSLSMRPNDVYTCVHVYYNISVTLCTASYLFLQLQRVAQNISAESYSNNSSSFTNCSQPSNSNYSSTNHSQNSSTYPTSTLNHQPPNSIHSLATTSTFPPPSCWVRKFGSFVDDLDRITRLMLILSGF